ncbi:glycosyltransferase family 2 protein [Microbacterium oryzae]|uniref:glycosyltransferase family 2 protein n=1 Tax=Microbacterium oryzae TaxID=743009 RepID=UPI0025B1637C|nr:glycosyltransferase family 2 protein [Microbacterium oryzae]MDN3309943.1 glycosyltransferase family 2 protein [Microbacterium oryzae]
MTERPVLSVVIPVHDVAPWIGETLETVLAQDVDAMEVLVVDDDSRDATPEIVADVAARDPRVRLVSAAGRGGGTARNTGIDAARGRYLVFCDGDDLVPDGAYAALVASLERSGSDIAFGDYLKFRPADTWRPTDAMPAFDHPASGIALRDEPTLLFSRPCWNKAFALDWLRAAGTRFPDVPRSNDIVPMVRAYLLARRVDIIPDVVYLYRERPGATSMSARADAAPSLLSYLGQELACARLVADAGDAGLSAVYAELVRERDGFIHIARWAARADADDAAAVREAVRALLDATPPVSDGDPLRALVLRLVVAGEHAAARPLARWLLALPAEDDVAADWTAALERLGEVAALTPAEVEALITPLTTALRVQPAALADWLRLERTVRRVLGERAVMLVPEARLSDADAERALAARERMAGRVTRVGRLRHGALLVEGKSAEGARAALPVLHDGEFAGAPVIEPSDVRWRADDAGGWRWQAVFAVRALPMHRPLTPALRDAVARCAVAVPGEGELPAYAPRDPLLYARVDGVTVVRRRRHWAPRAMRRAVIIARARLRR